MIILWICLIVNLVVYEFWVLLFYGYSLFGGLSYVLFYSFVFIGSLFVICYLDCE